MKSKSNTVKKSFISKWKEAFTKKEFRLLFIITIICLVITLYFFTKFLAYNETRPGFSFHDPILDMFPPVDVDWFAFTLIYGGIVTAIFTLTRHPVYLSLAFQSYTIMVLFRICAMYSIPLDPPPVTIALVDPLVEFFGTGETLMKDLFFSGHTSTMFLLFLTAQDKKLKTLFLICTILVGSAVIVQHSHYTVDVIAAPFFAYTSYRIAYHLHKKVLTNI